jgi:DNA-binding transcriptional LysR family regulator
LRQGELDLAILAVHERRVPGLELTALASNPIELACHKHHRLAARKRIELADLADETFVDLPVGWGVRTATDLAFAAAGVRRAVTMEIDDVLELMRMVAARLGVALLPPSIVTDADLRTVPIRPHAPVHHVAVAVPTVRRPSAATRALLGAILAAPALKTD